MRDFLFYTILKIPEGHRVYCTQSRQGAKLPPILNWKTLDLKQSKLGDLEIYCLKVCCLNVCRLIVCCLKVCRLYSY